MSVSRAFFGLCAVILLVISFNVSAQQQKRLALVIGNADYSNAPELRNPTHDARAMSAKLRQLGFKVITVVNGTYRMMVSAEDSFANELDRYDVGLFYYSGHGVQYQGTNYLIPVNANIQRAVDIQFEALNATRVLADMESAGTSVNLMILDACRNNPFASEFRSMNRGLSVVQAPAGSMVVYSTAPDRVALDGNGKDSPFTAALLKYIETPGVSVQDMLTSVFQQVQKETRGKQVPWESSSLTVPFYFAAEAPQVASVAKQPAPNQSGPAPTTPGGPAASTPSFPQQPSPRPTPAPVSAAIPSSQQASPGPAPPSAAQPSATAPAPSSGSSLSVSNPAEAVRTGQLEINIKTLVPYTPKSTVTFSWPGGRRRISASTYYPTRMSLPPGTYKVTASLSGDPGIGYRGQIRIASGRTTALKIPLSFSTGYRIRTLERRRNYNLSVTDALERQRRQKGRGATLLTLLGLAGGAAAYFSYSAGATAYSSYEAATTASDAQSYRSQATTYGTIAVASGIGGALSLISALATISHRPPIARIQQLENARSALDAQIQALRAQESSPQ